MGLLDRLAGLFDSDEEERKRFECEDCGTTYETEASREPECPDCGAGGAAAVPKIA